MPYKEKEINKLYFSIGEVSKILNVNPSLIRFWEKYFGLVKPKKNRKGNRIFITSEIDVLKQIHELVKEKGYTLHGAKEHLLKGNSPIVNKEKVLKSLMDLKQFLLEIKDQV